MYYGVWITRERTMTVLYCSPEPTDLHTYYLRYTQVDCFKIFCINFMLKSDMMVL